MTDLFVDLKIILGDQREIAFSSNENMNNVFSIQLC